VNVSINAGDTVHWINNGTPHTATSNGKPGAVFNCAPASAETFDSGNMSHGATFDHMFMNPGTYSYHCEIHGCMMAGTITVH